MTYWKQLMSSCFLKIYDILDFLNCLYLLQTLQYILTFIQSSRQSRLV